MRCHRYWSKLWLYRTRLIESHDFWFFNLFSRIFPVFDPFRWQKEFQNNLTLCVKEFCVDLALIIIVKVQKTVRARQYIGKSFAALYLEINHALVGSYIDKRNSWRIHKSIRKSEAEPRFFQTNPLFLYFKRKLFVAHVSFRATWCSSVWFAQ